MGHYWNICSEQLELKFSGILKKCRILSSTIFPKSRRLGHSSTSYFCPLVEGHPQEWLSSPINSELLLGNRWIISCGFRKGPELKIGKVHIFVWKNLGLQELLQLQLQSTVSWKDVAGTAKMPAAAHASINKSLSSGLQDAGISQRQI